jgi:hypothetical protein
VALFGVCYSLSSHAVVGTEELSTASAALARQIPYPLAFVFSHLHSTVLSILQIWTISSSWLAYKRTSKLSAI